MADIRQPLAEVFGHLPTDSTEKADRYRSHRLCPFNNKVPNCTKDKAKDPLGVCSIYHENHPVITCPIRFREDCNSLAKLSVSQNYLKNCWRSQNRYAI